jgi:hypothetical protein
MTEKIKMQLNHNIIPGVSLAGIRLDDNVNETIKRLSEHFNVSKVNGIVTINDGIIIIGYDTDESIYSVMCNSKSRINYENKLWPGMSVKDVLNHSKEQVAWGGSVVVDGINGIGLPLPKEFDDFSHITDWLPLDYIFEYLSIFRL